MKTTVGHLLVNRSLPKPLRDYSSPWTKGKLRSTFQDLAEQYPDKYKGAIYELKRLGDKVGYEKGSSFRLEDFRSPVDVKKGFAKVQKKIAAMSMAGLTEKEKDTKVAGEYAKFSAALEDEVFNAGIAQGNRLAQHVASGARGKRNQLKSTIGAPILVSDHKQQPILVPITSSYSEGLDPSEYWAASYGTRQGVISTKFATQEAGAFGKQLAAASMSLVVTENDCGTNNGVSRRTNDMEILDNYLAAPAAGLAKNTLITPEVIRKFKKKNVSNIIVRSPLTCEAHKGMCKYCTGITEKNRLPELGDNLGINASASLSEPLAQGGMDTKHTGGVIGAKKVTVTGFKHISRLANIPKTFQNKSTLSEVDGKVTGVEKAPQGGNVVTVENERHYTLPGHALKIRVGDKLEAGDQLSEGVINPAEVVRLKGLGAGRKYLAESLKDAFDASEMGVNRKNFELISRAVVNHVQVLDPDGIGDALPDDIVDYQTLAKDYTPRGAKEVSLAKASGTYLAKPYLHHTIGTRVTPSIAREIVKGLKRSTVEVTEEPPPFAPLMLRLADVPRWKPDWKSRLYSTHLMDSLLKGVHRGSESPEHGTSFVGPLAKGRGFGLPPKGTVGY